MATLSQLTERLEQIKAAKQSGALIVRHGDTQTTFRSLAEMDKIIADLTAEINALNGEGARKPRYIRQVRRGW